jgi:hypothetical protein
MWGRIRMKGTDPKMMIVMTRLRMKPPGVARTAGKGPPVNGRR